MHEIRNSRVNNVVFVAVHVFAILVYKDGEWQFQVDHEVGKAYGDNKERIIYNLLENFLSC
jgi:hypothetical protein